MVFQALLKSPMEIMSPSVATTTKADIHSWHLSLDLAGTSKVFPSFQRVSTKEIEYFQSVKKSCALFEKD